MKKDYCFCTLAFGEFFRNAALNLAKDLKKYAKGINLVVLTDNPESFKNKRNVLAFKHKIQSIRYCYNDKPYVIEKALSLFNTAIFIDGDSIIVSKIPDVKWKPGVKGISRNVLEHGANKRSQKRLKMLKHLILKLNIPIEKTYWIGEGLFIVTKDKGKEDEFIRLWKKLGRYFELKGIYDGEGSSMGLAAVYVGWSVRKKESQKLRKSIKFVHYRPIKTWKQRFVENINYLYRLNKARIKALKDFKFYYL